MSVATYAVLSGGFFLDDARRYFGAGRVIALGDDRAEVGAQLHELAADGVELLAVYGDDALVGRAISALLGDVSLVASGMRVWPCGPQGASVVGEALGAEMKPARAARALSEAAEWPVQMTPTLKVSASTLGGARYGFSFGAGWVYRARRAQREAQKGAGRLVSAVARLASDTLRETQGQDVAARMRVDRAVVEMHQGSVVATSLERTWYGLRNPAAQPAIWAHIPTRALVSQGLKPELLESVGEGAGRAAALDELVLDAPSGWVLDGELFAPDEGCVLRVSPGPKVALLRPPGRLGALVSRVLDGRGR
ncbi:hypothetical protein FRC96_13120 [Lujinxingia vulgaris]|uniref:Uncharacterized protein n=1 Tax=Lujinxingia vulgaris TaxID=2600176 RepID=A0A5C6XBN6_9DELT|nr:hypothetical protein [Lujinxingia vulgaris]TXD34555.1 hypothetical protein FRC96_13120 [Lujinxingia vulgaris]